MNYGELYEGLSSEFPMDALHVDASRGKDVMLVGAKIGWVIDWLNKKLGICGVGWRFDYSNPEIDGKRARTYVVLQYRVNPDDGVRAFGYNMSNGLVKVNGSAKVWSEPITAIGEAMVIGGRIGDAVKSAVSHGLSKASSYIGVAIANYMGMYTVEDDGETIVRTDGESSGAVVSLVETLIHADPEAIEELRSQYPEIDKVVKGRYHLGLHNYMESNERAKEFFSRNSEAILQGSAFSALTVPRVLVIYKVLSSYQKDMDMTEEDALSLLTGNQPADEPSNVIEE